MSKFKIRKDAGRSINKNCYVIARVIGTDFYLLHQDRKPQAYEIRSKGKADLSFSGEDPEDLINQLRAWAVNHSRVLLTYNLTRGE